ncbi:Lrp/AsnC family transcriptional regulator [Streptomyces albulus]|nr:Lrp/AsnC family transcriptional regulator [Streptomyces noursei]
MQALQADGRTSYADLAERVGMSPAAARARSLRLLEAGMLRVVALTSPGAVGLGYLAGSRCAGRAPGRTWPGWWPPRRCSSPRSAWGGPT